MKFKRSMTPPPAGSVNHSLITPPLTPGAPRNSLPRTSIPPSPRGLHVDSLAAGLKRAAKLHTWLPGSKRSQTVGVQKTASRVAKPKISIAKTIETVAEGKKTIGLMDMPGEIRNVIYSHTAGNSRQALLVHRPRIASLRARTRLDRHRTLESDVLEKEHDEALAGLSTRARSCTASSKRKIRTAVLARETNRPCFGLTQVCRLLRQEFRPIYMQRQEIGMDLVEVASYLSTFYPDAADNLKKLSTSKDRKIDMVYTGNMTIAVGDRVKQVEKSMNGIDILPLLDIWANSFKIEAGFGRYMQAHYDATADGEAKDLYRLFGRRVQQDRRCSTMNTLWRTILRTRTLAAIKIHRQPGLSQASSPAPAIQTASILAQPAVASEPRPYIHVLFKPESAELWMIDLESQIPQGWLAARGFDAMEYFEVKVGVAPAAGK